MSRMFRNSQRGSTSSGEMDMVDDMAGLPTLDEVTLLEGIRNRYKQDVIYTYIGDILIAVNPYKPIAIYDTTFQDRYRCLKFLKELPPHLFALSDRAYQTMLQTGNNQCCVVSGESGAGKTESTKLLVEHITWLCDSSSSRLHERIVKVNPLLEAFANARTTMNNNSSRFGKYIELKFDPDGNMLGANINEYLLEKTRVVSQGEGERNFHIFYYMFAGLNEEQLQFNLLKHAEDHRILRRAEGQTIFESEDEFLHNRDMWHKFSDIMNLVGFSDEDRDSILAILAAILHLTDIQFEPDSATEGVFITDETMLEMAGELLAVSLDELAAALISNVTNVRGESILTFKGLSQAEDSRDALAKMLYGRLFGWIVRQVNQLFKPKRASPGPAIGILDIAGFENFKNNSYEQLCINVTNEQLQYFFNQHIFQWELDEYKREGIKGKDIKFVDNRPLIEICLQAPLGLFTLMDEESRFPKASDQTLLEKLHKNIGKKSLFEKPKGRELNFTLFHFAGPVVYNVSGFLEKNQDTLSLNLMNCMMHSESQLVSDMFFAAISDVGTLMPSSNAPSRSRKSLLLCKAPELSLTKGKSVSKKQGLKLKEKARRGEYNTFDNTIRTAGLRFRNSLTDLMAKLLDAQPQFVRCIKPNQVMKQELFNQEVVLLQLRYTGVLETVKIRRQGYATRLPHKVFFNRYRALAFPVTASMEPSPANCGRILQVAAFKGAEIGKTKVFLKYWHVEQLNAGLLPIASKIVFSQKYARGWLARRRVSALWQSAQKDMFDIRDLCLQVTELNKGLHHQLVKRGEQDVERLQIMKEEEGEIKLCHLLTKLNNDLDHQLVKRGEQDVERLQITKEEEGEIKLKLVQARLRPPSTVVPGARKGLYQPTPILLGNNVYGDSKLITRDPNERAERQRQEPVSPPTPLPKPYRTEPQAINGSPRLIRQQQPPQVNKPAASNLGQQPNGAPRKGLKRTPIDEVPSPTNEPNPYPTITSPVKLRNPTEYNPSSHLARPNPVSPSALNPAKPGQSMMQMAGSFTAQVSETVMKLPTLDKVMWAKVLYYEKSRLIDKMYVSNWEFIIDNSSSSFDGKVIGLGAFSNPQRDSETQKIIKQIGKGIKIYRDEVGNIFARKLCDSAVIVKGHKEPQNHCLSSDIIERYGRLTEDVVKIYDVNEFKSHIAMEIQKSSVDHQRLLSMSTVRFSFAKNTFNDLQTPSWICIINLNALHCIGSESVLEEVKSMAHIKLSEVENVQLKRMWCNLKIDTDRNSRSDEEVRKVDSPTLMRFKEREDPRVLNLNNSNNSVTGHQEGVYASSPRSTIQKKSWAKSALRRENEK